MFSTQDYAVNVYVKKRGIVYILSDELDCDRPHCALNVPCVYFGLFELKCENVVCL